MYKKTYSFLKEVDSLALANVQLHLEKAYKNFFRDPKVGFPRFKSKHHSKNSYTTNVVNGNILIEGSRIRLPKLKWISMKKHREPAENWRLKSVTVSMEPSGKYFASLLYEGYSCENQAADKDYSNAKILGIDYAMQGMAVFSEEIELEKAGFFRKNEKRLAREQRKLSRCVKGSHNYVRQKKKVARCHEKIRSQRRDYLHKLSRRITDQYDIVAVEDIDMKAMSQCLHFGKSVQDNGYGMFRNMLDYKLAWKGKELVKVDRFFPSSKKCSKCGKIKNAQKHPDEYRDLIVRVAGYSDHFRNLDKALQDEIIERTEQSFLLKNVREGSRQAAFSVIITKYEEVILMKKEYLYAGTSVLCFGTARLKAQTAFVINELWPALIILFSAGF